MVNKPLIRPGISENTEGSPKMASRNPRDSFGLPPGPQDAIVTNEGLGWDFPILKMVHDPGGDEPASWVGVVPMEAPEIDGIFKTKKLMVDWLAVPVFPFLFAGKSIDFLGCNGS